MIVSSFFVFIKNFSKKLLPLLSLEMFMISLILYFFLSVKDSSISLFSLFLLFLMMMVLDSVLGLCFIISSCRSSDNTWFSFF